MTYFIKRIKPIDLNSGELAPPQRGVTYKTLLIILYE